MPRGVNVRVWAAPHVGGGEEHAHQVLMRLNASGIRTVLFASQCPHLDKTFECSPEEEEEFDCNCGYPVVRYRSLFGSGQWRFPSGIAGRQIVGQIYRLLKSEHADFVIDDPASSLLALETALAARLARLPLIRVIHHVAPALAQPTLKLRLKSYVEKIALKVPRRQRTIVVSQAGFDDAVKLGVQPQTIRMAVNGVDTVAIRNFQNSPPHGVFERLASLGFPTQAGQIILSVCRTDTYKGLDRMIEIMPRVRQHYPDARYVIVGNGPDMPRIRRLAKESPAREGIQLMGRLSDEEKFACYQLCAIYAMPSLIEGFGLVFLEANAFGKAVIGVDAMGTPEAILHGETGLLTTPGDHRDLGDAVLRLLGDPSYSARLGENGRLRVERDFSWDWTAKQYQDVIYEVTRG